MRDHLHKPKLSAFALLFALSVSVCSFVSACHSDDDSAKLGVDIGAKADETTIHYNTSTHTFGVKDGSLTGTQHAANLSLSGYVLRKVTAGITASTTQTPDGGTALTCEICEVHTVANASDTVTLDTAAAGKEQLVINNGAHKAKVCPHITDDLGAGANTCVTLDGGTNFHFAAYDSTNWERE